MANQSNQGLSVNDVLSQLLNTQSPLMIKARKPLEDATNFLSALVDTPMGQGYGTGVAMKAIQGPQQQQLGPYAEGVKKALKAGGEQHATEALAAGVPAQHIEQNTPGLSPSPTPEQAQAIPQQQGQAGLTMNPPTGPMAMGGANIQNGQVSINQASPIIKGLLNWIGMGQNSLINQDINTISGAQGISGGQPIQPIQKVEMGAKMYSAQVEALNKEVADASTQIQTLLKQKSDALAHPFQTGSFGTDMIKNIDAQIKEQHDRQIAAQNRLMQFTGSGQGKQGNEQVKGKFTSITPSGMKYRVVK